ncbi:hypothetical protein [Escherichia coli]
MSIIILATISTTKENK